jgi:hypothetical protein
MFAIVCTKSSSKCSQVNDLVDRWSVAIAATENSSLQENIQRKERAHHLNSSVSPKPGVRRATEHPAFRRIVLNTAYQITLRPVMFCQASPMVRLNPARDALKIAEHRVVTILACESLEILRVSARNSSCAHLRGIMADLDSMPY